MRRFRHSLFALAAFLWLPASAHCQLEKIPGLEFLRCAAVVSDSPGTPDDCNHCCAVEKSEYRADSASFNIPTPEQLALPICTAGVVVVSALPDEVALGVLVAAPPELFPTRHFLSRTALPARAPSLLS